MATTYYEDIQKLYVAYFNRPADYAGLLFWETVLEGNGGKTAVISNEFAKSNEYKAAYANMSNFQIINAIYRNLFGRDADVPGATFWATAMTNGQVTIADAVTQIAAGAQGADATAYANKVTAATAFTNALADSITEINGYNGTTANAAAATWLAGITTDATLAAALTPATLNATVTTITTVPVPPVNFQLTAGVDTFSGGAGNDVVTATTSAGVMALTTFDNINGGAGIDTIQFVETGSAATDVLALPTTATVAGFELVNVTTTGGANINTKAWSGVTGVTVTAAGTAAASVTAADTTDVTLASATTGLTTVTGGKAVNIGLSAAGAGAVSVTGAGLTNVTVKGGAAVTVDNTKADGTTAAGTTLTTVTVDGTTGATTALKGAALTNVNLANYKVDNGVTITNGTASHALNLGLDAVGYSGSTAKAVTVTDNKATTANVNTTSKSIITLAGTELTTVNLAGAGTLALVSDAGNSKLTTVAGATATGDVTLTGLGADVLSITTGAGNDTVTVASKSVKDDTSTTGVDETKSATVNTGAGNDTINLALDAAGTGKVTVEAGAGNDTVNITARGTETLVINLGDGNDSLKAGAGISINGTDTINAGAGSDTLLLKLVGAANIGAFSNFDVFDTAGLSKTLDVDILATKNTVSEIIASADVGASAALTNVGAGVNFRVTGDMRTAPATDVAVTNTLSLTQKTAGAFTVTVDADESGDADTGADTTMASVNVTNASSLKAVFATDYLAKMAGETTTGDNVTTLTLSGAAATLAVEAGGKDANDVLVYTDNASGDALTTVTVTGAQALNLSVASASKLVTVDASAHTGGLTFNTDNLKDGGVVKIGSGVDVITVGTTGSTAAAPESVQGFEKAAAVAVSVVAGDLTAKNAAIADADTLVFATGAVAGDITVTGGAVSKGVLTFTGAGPATLTDAFGIANAAADGTGEVVVFQYLNDSYAFQQGTTDLAIKLVGVTGVTNLVETATDGQFFIV